MIPLTFFLLTSKHLVYQCLGYWCLGYWCLGYWCLGYILTIDVLATDILITDFLANNVLATDICGSDIFGTDIFATEILLLKNWRLVYLATNFAASDGFTRLRTLWIRVWATFGKHSGCLNCSLTEKNRFTGPTGRIVNFLRRFNEGLMKT